MTDAVQSLDDALRDQIELHYRTRLEAIERREVTPRLAAEVFANAALGLLHGAELAGADSEQWRKELGATDSAAR